MQKTRTTSLEELVIGSLAEGRIVTSRCLSKQWGADRFRVEDILIRCCRAGLCRARVMHPKPRKDGLVGLPHNVFIPIKATLRERISGGKRSA